MMPIVSQIHVIESRITLEGDSVIPGAGPIEYEVLRAPAQLVRLTCSPEAP